MSGGLSWGNGYGGRFADKLLGRLRDHSSTPEQIVEVLREGASPNQSGQSGLSFQDHPVILAAQHPNTDVLRVILEWGGNPNFASDGGSTPYLYAISIPHIQLLIDHGARYPEPTTGGETPLKQAYGYLNLEKVSYLLAAGAPSEEIECTPIHLAILQRTRDVSQVVADHLGLLEVKDEYDRTPLLLAFLVGDVAAARVLVETGASLKAQDHVGQTCVHMAAESGSFDSLRYADELGFDLGQLDGQDYSPLVRAVQSSKLSAVEYLLGVLVEREDYFDQLDEALNHAFNVEIAQKLLSKGAKFDAMDSEMRQRMNPSGGLNFPLEKISKVEYERAKRPRFGATNPEERNEPFWQSMVVTRKNGYRAREHFGDAAKFVCGEKDPVWCADRFGQSMTTLPDGRIIEIAGEHEDGYDPDFCIYNDVIVHEPGKLPRIFLYPREEFPPTDFHSATLVEDWIYIIGSLGYGEDRLVNKCPVYRLNIHSLQIEMVTTSGSDPGRIQRHRAILVGPTKIEVSDGGLSAQEVTFGTKHPKSILDVSNNTWWASPKL